MSLISRLFNRSEREISLTTAVAAYEAGQYEIAVSHLTKLAEMGNPTAQNNLAHMYNQGLGVAQDDNKAFLLYQQAADSGLNDAYMGLGYAYETGSGVNQNIDKAISCYLLVAEQGNVDVENNLGGLYRDKGEYEEAVRWLERAAMRGDPKAQFNLGNCYGLGQGVTESRDTAVFWLTEAAKQGHAAAFELLKRISNSSVQK